MRANLNSVGPRRLYLVFPVSMFKIEGSTEGAFNVFEAK